MPKATVEVRIADMKTFKAFIGAVVGLCKALADCEGLPEPVMDAADHVRREVAALGGRDIGPRP